MTESLRSVYGDGIAVDGYLRKFFDFHVELSPLLYAEFTQLLARSLRLEESVPNRFNDWLTLFPSWCQALRLSLRAQEQVLSQANFIARTFGNNMIWLIYDLIIILLCIRAKSDELFAQIYSENLEVNNLISEVQKLFGNAAEEESDGDRILRYGIMVLLAGFVPAELIRAEHRVLADRLSSEQSKAMAGEMRHLERQVALLAQAFETSERYGALLGRRVAKRIRYLAD